MKNKQRGWRLSAKTLAALVGGTITGLLLGGGAAFAAENESPDEYLLDDIIVTAQRVEKSEIDTPATTTVVTSEEMHRSGYRNAYEAIDQQIGSTSTSYGDTGQDFGFAAGRITLRGYDRGTLVMVNGVPMNLHNYPSTENIPISMIERIEIVKGASSTLYGPEAMGGVINIILKKPKAGEEHASVSGTVGNEFRKTELTYAGEKVIVGVSREWTKDRPHSNAFGIGEVSDTDWWVGKGKKSRVGIGLSLTDEISMNYDYTQSDITRGGARYPKGDKRKVPSRLFDYVYNDYRQTANLIYQGKANGVRALLGYNSRNSDAYDYIKNKPNDANRRLKTTVFDLQKTWQGDWGSIIAGYDYRHDSSKDTVYSEYDGSRSTNSLFASLSRQFTDKFSATFGLRGEFVNDVIDSQHVFLPQIQTNYKFDENTAWYINIGRAFQMPPIYNEMKARNGGLKELDPEQGWTYETGLKMRRGGETWKLAVYHMKMKDKFGWIDATKTGTGVAELINTGNFRNTGVETEYGHAFDDVWRLRIGAGFSNPEVENPSSTAGKLAGWVQDAGRVEFMTAVDYTKEKWSGNINFKYFGDRECYKNIDIPSRLSLNMNVNYKAGKYDEWTLGVYNILDKDNYSNRYGSLELGRNYRLTYTHSF